jgi:hypothetical protein
VESSVSFRKSKIYDIVNIGPDLIETKEWIARSIHLNMLEKLVIELERKNPRGCVCGENISDPLQLLGISYNEKAIIFCFDNPKTLGKSDQFSVSRREFDSKISEIKEMIERAKQYMR